ncbi:hypothetical protein MNEG_1977 [Monoraphidium neglectum]|uniref:Uncharacterized protein n=1 Tax=Monoraphidium neglectum TaxID=145388 RepID=A0A0D2N0A2_9CHLO|nr:hypothetical protein MNEG_1977 [Monoraphidium neglectum]KIZ05987.1 hypothetical protein MNEG_1977 [Monoraphidium neglectum]|eukprot:XP_013905006.1 hypothetical protein MNEG_1977 [Monoraphidium neglectum]
MQRLAELLLAVRAAANAKEATPSEYATHLKDTAEGLKAKLEDSFRQVQALEGRIEELQQALQAQEQLAAKLEIAMEVRL